MWLVDAVARHQPSILHVDIDAFYAAVEQRDKPSLRGRPVVVGGVGPRGVVATASYEARRFGVHSALSVAAARARCPQAAFLSPRFDVYRAASAQVMSALLELSPLVEPISLDEAFVDLAAGASSDLNAAVVREVASRLKATITRRTDLVVSVGAACSKLIAKIASDLDKPDGLVVIEPGSERELLRPMPVRTLWGVGPATADRLAHLGVRTIADLERLTQDELVAHLGAAHGRHLFRLARGEDDRAVVPERDVKSISVEDTFDHDVIDRRLLNALVHRMATRVCSRMVAAGVSGRTVVLKARLSDFTTLMRAQTLPAPTDDARLVSRVARRLLVEIDTGGGLRLLGVGVSGLADWVQDNLFAELDSLPAWAGSSPDPNFHVHASRRWWPGQDVVHARHGAGWVWGSGLGRVTVRFETRTTGPGPVRTLAWDDPELSGHSQPAQAD
jgi:DNA polymerase IV